MDGQQVLELSANQYETISNLLSLAIASLGFTGLYLGSRHAGCCPATATRSSCPRWSCFIATYHYVRIFNNFTNSLTRAAREPGFYQLTNVVFNEGYRYVDWLLTVPLLLVETVAVLALAAGRAEEPAHRSSCPRRRS